jgi:hypothetical protein
VLELDPGAARVVEQPDADMSPPGPAMKPSRDMVTDQSILATIER